METIEPLSLENILISWNIYHNFESPPDESKIEGNFNIDVFPAESKECEENASAINELKNPFPDLKFVNKDQNYSVTIPSHRLLTVTLEEEKVVFTFMPHGIKPIEGFPTENHISWGRCSINGDSDQNSKILKILIQILFINQKTPRSRCESCKGLKMLIGDSDSDFDSELYDHQLICYDCLQGSISFFKELTVQIEEFEKENNLDKSRETLFQLIDGGIDLADRLNNEKLHSEFLYFQALLLSKAEDLKAIQESLDLLERIIMFSSSWNYSKLREKSEKLKSKILENKNVIQSIEEEVILENQEPIKDIDNFVQIGIKYLQKAKNFEQQGKYQEAIYCIRKASKPLVDNGVWTDEDFQKGQQEIVRLTNLIKNVEPEPDDGVVPEPIKEVVPVPVEEVMPVPVEEVMPEPVEEVVPVPIQVPPKPVEAVSPEPIEEDPIIGSIEEIMKKIKKSNVLNLTLKPVIPPKPIKIVDNSIQDEENLESKEIPSIFPVETAEGKLEDEIRNIIEQQSSKDKKNSFEPTILSEESSVSINDQNSAEIIKPKEISEEKIEINPSIEEEKIEKAPKKLNRGYNLFGVPNRISNNKAPSIKIQDSEKQPSLKGTPVIRKSSKPKRLNRRRTFAKRTKPKIEICPMCGKLSCVCGYMDKVKKKNTKL